MTHRRGLRAFDALARGTGVLVRARDGCLDDVQNRPQNRIVRPQGPLDRRDQAPVARAAVTCRRRIGNPHGYNGTQARSPVRRIEKKDISPIAAKIYAKQTTGGVDREILLRLIILLDFSRRIFLMALEILALRARHVGTYYTLVDWIAYPRLESWRESMEEGTKS